MKPKIPSCFAHEQFHSFIWFCYGTLLDPIDIYDIFAFMFLKIQLRVGDLAKLAEAAPVRRSKVEVIELPIDLEHFYCNLFDEFLGLSFIDLLLLLLLCCQDMSAEVVDSNPYSRLMALQRMGIVDNYERIRDFSVAIVVCINLLYHSLLVVLSW